MARPFSINIHRHDPYKNFRFVVKFGTEAVAGVSKVTGLKRTSDVIEYKEGGNPIIVKGIGRTKYEPITLERGITHAKEFEQWANAVQKLDLGEPTATELLLVRKDIWIELLNEAGQTVYRYIVKGCWVSEYQALPDLDAGGNAIALEHVKLENEGWYRDETVTEPNEAGPG